MGRLKFWYIDREEKFMRVFDTYYYNIIDKVSYKETKPYLEQMFKEQGFSYKNISFMLNDFRKEYVEKVLSKFPTLKKYEFMEDGSGMTDYGITSIRENWKSGEVHTDKEDWQDISMVFSKIPRPYNFSSGKLILDGIDWFGDSDESVAITNWDYERDSFPTAYTPPFISNRILQYRSYDDGKKRNRISVTIEVTGEAGTLDSISIVNKLEPYLGTYNGFERLCTFDREEYQTYKELEKKHCEKVKELGNSFLPESNLAQRLRRNMFDDTTIPNVANKVTLDKVFKETRFKREKGQPNWLHQYSFVDDNGYKYDAYTQKISCGNEFRCWIEISGYNFSIEYRHEDYIVEEEGESLDILRAFARFCDKMVDDYSEELKADFGRTPEWYQI